MGSMAGILGQGMQVYGYGIKLVVGSFAPNGSGSLDQTQVRGTKFSVLRSNTGLFTVTLPGTALSLLSGTLTHQFSAASVVGLQFRAVDVQVAKTIQIAHSPAGADTDIAANTSNRVHFTLYLATGQLNKGTAG